MKLSEAKLKCAANYFEFVEIRRNPAAMTEFIAWLYARDGKSFMLCSDNDSVLSARDLELLVSTLKEAGFREAKIYF
jgi:hypothetical protein